MKVATASNPRLDQRWDQQLSPDTGCVCLPGGWSRVWTGSLVPLTFCCDPSMCPGLRSVCPASTPQKGPARACPLPVCLLSTEQPQKSHGGRHRQEPSCRDPSRCWGGLPAEGHVPGAGQNHDFCVANGTGLSAPAWVPAALFPQNCGGPDQPSDLELSLRAVPGARPLRGPGGAKVWGVARQVVPVPGEMAGGSGVYRGPGT